VKNAVVTLKGKVSPQSKRAEIARIAAAIPDVRQVVNELQPKD
jgi:osmotically-inducible protein OsmY